MVFGIPHFKKPQWVWTDIDIPGPTQSALRALPRTKPASAVTGSLHRAQAAATEIIDRNNHLSQQDQQGIASYLIIFHHIATYLIISHHISSYLLISHHISSYLIISPHISSYRIISHHIASYLIISQHILTSHHMSSYLLISQHIASYLLTSHHISPYLLISPHISSYLLISHHTSSYLLISHQISSYRSISHHISSYLLISHHISSYLIISPHISSYLLIYPHISSYLIISQHISHLSWFLRFTHPRPELVSWQLFWPKVHKFVATDLEANDPSHFKKALKQHTAPLFKWHSCDFHVPHPTPEYAAKEVRWGTKPLKSLK